MESLTPQDFANLLEFRTGLRKFQRWSERQTRAVGLTPTQHQLLLAVKGHHGERPPTIGELAEHLVLRHHSTVELVNRAEAIGLVERRRDADARDARDARVVRVVLTPQGEERLAKLTEMHLQEIRGLAPLLEHLVSDLDH